MRERWGALPPYPRRVLIRLAYLPLLLFCFLTAIFLLVEVLPDPEPLTGERREQVCTLYPDYIACSSTLERYGDFWRDLITVDLGTSLVNNRPISESLRARWFPSFELLLLTVTFAAATAALMGIPRFTRASARSTAWSRGLGALLSSVPVAAALTAILILPYEWWDVAPPIGTYHRPWHDPLGNLGQFGPPALVTGVLIGAWSSRLVRQSFAGRRLTASTIARALALAATDAAPLALTALLFIEFIYTIPGVGEFFVRTASFHDFNALEASSAIFVITGLLFWVFNPGTTSDGAAKPSVPIAWRSNRSLLVGVVLVGLVVLAGVLGPTLTPHDPIHFSGTQVEGPSSTHWLGTDRLGRDILSRILEGTRTALILASSVIVLGFLPGFAFAGIVRRYSSRVGQILDWSSSAWVAVGAFFWLLLFQLALYDNPGWIGLLVPMSIFAFMLGVRSTRIVERAGTPFITLLRNPEVHAAFICGAVTAAAAAVVAEVYLSYLGVTTLRNISLGTEMARAREFLPYDHWQLWSPAVVITIIVFSFLLIRTSLDDEVPPRTYER